jgi:hypothetical protein
MSGVPESTAPTELESSMIMESRQRMTLESQNHWIARILIAALLTVYCGFAEGAQAQTDSQAAQPQTSAPARSATPPAGTAQQPTDDSQAAPPQNPPAGIVDPSQGPLAPVPEGTQANPNELPNAPSRTPNRQNAPAQQPVGAAAAQVGPTSGGAASKPAGNAIAPAKQRQTRSFLIKMGAVAATAVAVGTVVALSKGTSSKPPGAK